jgi:hypothetical protein
MKNITYILFVITSIAMIGCKKELPKGMEPGFFKIYDDQISSNNYRTLDIHETSDGGSLILASVNHTQIYVLRVNEKGEYMTSAEVSGGNKHPLPNLLYINNTYYAGCMDEVGLFTRILQIDENTCAASTVAEFPNLLYPLAFSAVDNSSILLLGYDRWAYTSQLSKISLGGQVEWTKNINVFQDTEAQIVSHLNGTGKRYPFYTAGWNGKYVANCFNNYSFSFLVFDGGAVSPDAIYNGSHFSSGTSAFIDLGAGSAAITRFSFGKSYLIPSFPQASGVVGLTDDMGGLLVEEAESDAEFKLGSITVDNTPYLCYAYNTQNGRVATGFLSSSGELKARKYFGSSNNPFKIGNFIPTSDKGLMVAGTFYVAGAFPRPALFKLNEKELFEIMGLKYE